MEKMTIKEAREKSGKSIRKMAFLMGLSKNTYVNKESGLSRFYIDEAIKFSEIVGIPQKRIIFFESDVP